MACIESRGMHRERGKRKHTVRNTWHALKAGARSWIRGMHGGTVVHCKGRGMHLEQGHVQGEFCVLQGQRHAPGAGACTEGGTLRSARYALRRSAAAHSRAESLGRAGVRARGRRMHTLQASPCPCAQGGAAPGRPSLAAAPRAARCPSWTPCHCTAPAWAAAPQTRWPVLPWRLHLSARLPPLESAHKCKLVFS